LRRRVLRRSTGPGTPPPFLPPLASAPAPRPLRSAGPRRPRSPPCRWGGGAGACQPDEGGGARRGQLQMVSHYFYVLLTFHLLQYCLFASLLFSYTADQVLLPLMVPDTV